MKLLLYKNRIQRLPISKELKRALFKLRREDLYVVLAPDELETREVKGPKIDFTITSEAEANLLKILNSDQEFSAKIKELAPNYLVAISFTGTDYTELQVILNDPSTKYQVVGPEFGEKLTLFDVGRINGPTDKVVVDQDYEGINIRYDVNSRIRISKHNYVLTYTYKPIKQQNMAKLVKPSGEEVVILQQDFDIWLMGVYVFLNDWNDVDEMFSNLIKKYE